MTALIPFIHLTVSLTISLLYPFIKTCSTESSTSNVSGTFSSFTFYVNLNVGFAETAKNTFINYPIWYLAMQKVSVLTANVLKYLPLISFIQRQVTSPGYSE